MLISRNTNHVKSRNKYCLELIKFIKFKLFNVHIRKAASNSHWASASLGHRE